MKSPVSSFMQLYLDEILNNKPVSVMKVLRI